MKLAPRMIQSMEILQLPIMALQERIEQEMSDNPMLEVQEKDPSLPEESSEQKESPEAPDVEQKELVVDEAHNNADDFERLDDRRDHLLFSRLGLMLRLHRMKDEHLLWDREFVDPRSPEDAPHLFDQTEDFRGVTTGVGGPKLLRLDPDQQPRMAFEDMVAHVERRLQFVTASSLAGIESALQAGFAID